MYNCKSGDIAVITWDEEPVFSNIGKLVRVDGPPCHDLEFGLTWFITPIDYADGYLFIEEREDGTETVKVWEPSDEDIGHPDAWLRPLENPDKSQEEMEQEVTTKTGRPTEEKTRERQAVIAKASADRGISMASEYDPVHMFGKRALTPYVFLMF